MRRFSDEDLRTFSNQLAVMGLQLREIAGDGNCLFRALCDQLEGHSRNHLQHRKATVKYMIENRSDFEPFIDDNSTFEEYVEKLRQDGTFAGNDAIVAYARHYDVKVVIHQLCAPVWLIDGNPCCPAPELHIAYHNGDHYSSVRRIDDESSKPAEICLADLKNESQRHGRKRKRGSFETESKVREIMEATGCDDYNLVEKLLKRYNYDVDQVVMYMTEGSNVCVGHHDDDSSPLPAPKSPRRTSRTSTPSDTPLPAHTSNRFKPVLTVCDEPNKQCNPKKYRPVPCQPPYCVTTPSGTNKAVYPSKEHRSSQTSSKITLETRYKARDSQLSLPDAAKAEEDRKPATKSKPRKKSETPAPDAKEPASKRRRNGSRVVSNDDESPKQEGDVEKPENEKEQQNGAKPAPGEIPCNDCTSFGALDFDLNLKKPLSITYTSNSSPIGLPDWYVNFLLVLMCVCTIYWVIKVG